MQTAAYVNVEPVSKEDRSGLAVVGVAAFVPAAPRLGCPITWGIYNNNIYYVWTERERVRGSARRERV